MPYDFSTIRCDGRIIPCTIRLEENQDNRLYWLSLGETELALYFYNDPKHFEEEIIGATERQNYWCVEVTDLFSVERGKGYATMLSRMRNQLLIACSEYNRIPIYAYLEDGSYTGWTSAAAKNVGFQPIPHLLYRREK